MRVRSQQGIQYVRATAEARGLQTLDRTLYSDQATMCMQRTAMNYRLGQIDGLQRSPRTRGGCLQLRRVRRANLHSNFKSGDHAILSTAPLFQLAVRRAVGYGPTMRADLCLKREPEQRP